MKPAAARLALAVVLFVSWVGYLGYLAATTRPPANGILSRPQFLVSQLDVIARVEEPEGQPPRVTVEKVHWPQDDEARQLVGKQIEVLDLAKSDGWVGPNTYILPLTRAGKETYRVAPIPRSPGFERHQTRIYLATPQTRYQLDTIQKPETVELEN